MIRLGDKIRLTASERKFLSDVSFEPVNPQTVHDYEAWVKRAITLWSGNTPEEKLMREILLNDLKNAP